MSVHGPSRQILHRNQMSAFGGTAEVARTFQDRETTRARVRRTYYRVGQNKPRRGGTRKKPGRNPGLSLFQLGAAQ
jgi:hypothetical protein